MCSVQYVETGLILFSKNVAVLIQLMDEERRPPKFISLLFLFLVYTNAFQLFCARVRCQIPGCWPAFLVRIWANMRFAMNEPAENVNKMLLLYLCHLCHQRRWCLASFIWSTVNEPTWSLLATAPVTVHRSFGSILVACLVFQHRVGPNQGLKAIQYTELIRLTVKIAVCKGLLGKNAHQDGSDHVWSPSLTDSERVFRSLRL